MAYKKWRESYRLNVKNGIRINRVSGISATLLSGAQERAHTTRSTHTNENGRIGGKEEEATKKTEAKPATAYHNIQETATATAMAQ